jgi:hypothetical protein
VRKGAIHEHTLATQQSQRRAHRGRVVRTARKSAPLRTLQSADEVIE